MGVPIGFVIFKKDATSLYARYGTTADRCWADKFKGASERMDFEHRKDEDP